MRYVWLALSLVLGISACSKVHEETAGGGGSTSSTADAEGETAPGVATAVAPGVAFDYRYTFRLAEKRIAAVQEQHAALCGRLGITHCRVTGLSFEKTRSGHVNASIAFKLDPAMALGFAKDATALVERADGTLEHSNVSGEDVGKTIVAGDKSADGIRAELAKIDAQLRIPGLSKQARGTLVGQATALRGELRALGAGRDAAVESLATTPVAFDYETAAARVGFGDALKSGLGASATSMSALLSVLALVLGVGGPWALLIGGAWWAVRKWRGKPAAAAVPD